MVVDFPVKESHFDRRKDDISVWEQLELAAQTQAKWSDNSVSITVTVKKDEIDLLPRALAMYGSRLKSVSFLPLTDHSYAQAPYETITRKKFEQLSKGLKKPRLNSTLDEEDKILERFCDADGVCEIP